MMYKRENGKSTVDAYSLTLVLSISLIFGKAKH